jgi:hypothetical protein
VAGTGGASHPMTQFQRMLLVEKQLARDRRLWA